MAIILTTNLWVCCQPLDNVVCTELGMKWMFSKNWSNRIESQHVREVLHWKGPLIMLLQAFAFIFGMENDLPLSVTTFSILLTLEDAEY